MLKAVLCRVSDQAPRIVEPVHHIIANVDASGTADALVLQPLTDIDPGGTHLHAGRVRALVAQLRHEEGLLDLRVLVLIGEAIFALGAGRRDVDRIDLLNRLLRHCCAGCFGKPISR